MTLTEQEYLGGNYLEHYGRLGMKWYQHKYGDADGRAKYVDKWKKKEVARVEKRTNLWTNRMNKTAYKYLDKQMKAEDRGSNSSDKYYHKNKLAWKNEDDIRANGKKEVERIMSYTHEDILKEVSATRKNIAKNYAAAYLGGAIGLSLKQAYGNPLDSGEFKSKYRTGQNIDSITKKNYKADKAEQKKEKEERKKLHKQYGGKRGTVTIYYH